MSKRNLTNSVMFLRFLQNCQTASRGWDVCSPVSRDCPMSTQSHAIRPRQPRGQKALDFDAAANSHGFAFADGAGDDGSL
ncbi:unnamed protein product [Lota lota]